MAQYSYRARNPQGQPINGHVEAVDADAAASQLMRSGVIPITVEEASAKTAGNLRSLGGLRLRWQRAPGLVEMIQFSRQLHTLMRAGVPMIRALGGLAANVENPVFARVLQQMVQDLESGRDLAGALHQHPKVFSPLFVSMVQIGEQTGRLDEAFDKLAMYLEREKDTRERVKAAMRYPSFVLIAIAIAIGVINLFVIPTFASIFAKFQAELPWQTRVLLAVSDFSVAYWPYILLAMGGAMFGLRRYLRTDDGRLRWDRLKLRVPIIGPILNQSLLSRFANSFAMTYRSGVPLLQSLVVVARAVDNAFVEQHIQSMRNGIERGDSLTRTAQNTNMFTPLVLQMISVGEESGAVDEMLDYVAEFYDREVDYRLKNLSSAIEPVLIMIIGAMVLVLAMGVFLPMWDLARVVQGR